MMRLPWRLKSLFLESIRFGYNNRISASNRLTLLLRKTSYLGRVDERGIPSNTMGLYKRNPLSKVVNEDEAGQAVKARLNTVSSH